MIWKQLKKDQEAKIERDHIVVIITKREVTVMIKENREVLQLIHKVKLNNDHQW